MSSILKALKKLEHDKASYRPDELKIDAEILRADISPRFSAARVLVTSLLLLAGGSGATYLYMERDKAPKRVDPQTSVISRQDNRPVSSASDITTEQLPAAIEVKPARQQNNHQQNKRNAGAPPTHRPAMPAGTPRAVAAAKPAAQEAASQPASRAESTGSPPSSSSVKAVPALRVNGIAFQEGGSESVAMINGVPLLRGAVIDGVKIEEIHRNRVGFSCNGTTFEIQLGQSNR